MHTKNMHKKGQPRQLHSSDARHKPLHAVVVQVVEAQAPYQLVVAVVQRPPPLQDARVPHPARRRLDLLKRRRRGVNCCGSRR
jgi:hypothetical protein